MNEIQHIKSVDGLPKAVAPYSLMVISKIGNLKRHQISGVLPLNAEGNIVGETIGDQTAQVFHNIRLLLEHAGLTMDDVTELKVIVSDMAQFAELNAEYSKHVTADKEPARVALESPKLPLGALVEIKPEDIWTEDGN